MAVGVVDESRRDLWVFDVESAARLRLTNEADVRAPIWTPDGERIIFSWDKEPPGALFYRPSPPGTAGALFSIELTTEPRFAFTTARSVPAGDFVAEGGSRDYDITPVGQALLVVVHANEDAALPQINVVLNSFEELKDLVPVP